MKKQRYSKIFGASGKLIPVQTILVKNLKKFNCKIKSFMSYEHGDGRIN